MSKKEKLLGRFKSKPKDFTFDELETLLGYFGYYLDDKGKTSGSRVRFIKDGIDTPILMHKPHNTKTLLPYQINDILKELKKEDLI